MAAKHGAEYVIRVKTLADGGFTASCRQFACQHPEVRAVVGPVAYGRGETEPAAMLAAITNARIGEAP